jgi:hypothetical protein
MGTWPSKLGSLKWDSKIWSWVLCDFDLRVPALARPRSNCTSKLQAHPFIREGAPLQEICNHQKEKKNLVMAPRQAGRLTVGRKLTSTSIWTCGIQLWGRASTSNVEILERFQSKALHMIVDAPWYVPNTVIWRDLQISTDKEKILHYSSQYSACFSAHPNDLIVNLMELPDKRRLRRRLPNDLPTRFLV